MRYYKITSNNNLIGVGTSLDLRRHQKKHDMILVSGEKLVQFIEYNGAYYRDIWMRKLTSPDIEVQMATITEISESKYNALSEAKETDEILMQEDIIEKDLPEEEIAEIDQDIDYIKDMKIKKMSLACKKAITNGADITISGELRHFSFAIEDQMELENLINMSDSTVIYHADGELYQQYAKEDIQRIYSQFQNIKTVNRIYFNCLKRYINSLTTIDEINKVSYGMDIPEEFQTEIYKEISK